MKERPILFSAPMVRALLDSTKTQTRRVVKWRDLQPGLNLAFSGLQVHSYVPGLFTLESHSRAGIESRSSATRCPYGQPGDRLWVRESVGYVPTACGSEERVFAADYTDGSDKAAGVRYKPSIHMPRAACRIVLEISDVRVERLKAISDEDCIAEGCSKNHNGYYWGGPHQAGGLKQMATEKQAYRDLWESIHGPDSWSANPWVWAVSFKRVEARKP